jgi:hypothetical protein
MFGAWKAVDCQLVSGPAPMNSTQSDYIKIHRQVSRASIPIVEEYPVGAAGDRVGKGRRFRPGPPRRSH